MSRLTEKIKLPLAVILSAGLIIGFSAVIPTIYYGKLSTVTAVDESFSEIATDVTVTVAEALSEIDNLYLPDKTAHLRAERTETIRCKQYTQLKVFAEGCTVTVRKYNYANMAEDDQVSFPKNTKTIHIDGIDIFLFSQNGVSKALYYNGLARYTIETDASMDELFD